MNQLDNVASHQANWSATANALKKSVDRARSAALLLSIAGAIIATAASQIPDGSVRKWLAILAAICLALTSLITLRFVGGDQIRAWARARVASEGLKREAFRYAAEAVPYDNPTTAESLLDDESEKITADVDDLASQQIETKSTGSSPRKKLTRAEYIEKRIDGQIKYYKDNSGECATRARLLHWFEFGLVATATVITAIAGVTGKIVGIGSWTFDLAALTAVLTTIASAMLAHLESTRLEYLATTYRVTQRKLEAEKSRDSSTASWSEFVNNCENIIAVETSAWMAKWTK